MPPVLPRLFLAFLIGIPLIKRWTHRSSSVQETTTQLEVGSRMSDPLMALALPLARLAHSSTISNATYPFWPSAGGRMESCDEVKEHCLMAGSSQLSIIGGPPAQL